MGSFVFRGGVSLRYIFILFFLFFVISFFSCSEDPLDLVNDPPVIPYQPQPEGNKSVPASLRLSWNCYDPNGDPLLYDVYINGSLVGSSVTNQFYEVKLKYGLTYEWYIIAKDNKGNSTVGPKWLFNTDTLVYIADSAVVYASSYHSWDMVLNKGDKIQVSITSDTDVNVWLIPSEEFEFFVNGENFNFVREGSASRVVKFDFDFVVSEPGGYKLVLDNKFSWLTSKNVFVAVYWSHYRS